MRYLTILLALFWAPFAAAYEETLKIPGSPELRVALGPREAVEDFGYIGGEFVLRLQLVSAFAFEALNFTPPKVDGARLVQILTPRTKAVSTFAASGYIFETAYAIFPERTGELVIPPLVAEGVIEPAPGEPAPFRSETIEQRLVIRGVPPEFQGDWWVVTPRIKVEEVWSSPPEDAHEGDIIRREVIMTAYGVEAERLPELTLTGSHGAVVSDHGGWRKTSLSTEGVIGRVGKSWDIRIADPRVAVIGPVEMEHWHPGYHRSLIASAPARRIEPAPADPTAATEALMAEAARGRQAGLAVALALGGLILAPAAAAAIALALVASPTAADRRMRRALIGAAAPADAWRAVEIWSAESGITLSHVPDSHQRLSEALFSREGGDLDLKAVADDLAALSSSARRHKFRLNAEVWLASVIGRKAALSD